MKQIRITLALMVAASITLSSRKKEPVERPVSNTAFGNNSGGQAYRPAGQQDLTSPANIAYNFSTSISPNSIIYWQSGYMSVNNIGYEGVRLSGDALFLERFQTQNPFILQIPTQTARAMGAVDVAAAKYQGVKLGVGLMPGNAMSAFFLSGSYTTKSGRVIPVNFMVNEPLVMTAAWGQPWYTFNHGAKHAAYPTFDLATLTNGLDLGMFENLFQSPNTPPPHQEPVLVISATSHQEIYNMMKHNLQNTMYVFLAPVPSPPNNVTMQEALGQSK